jgi:flagellin-like hook-associated protein FlgL
MSITAYLASLSGGGGGTPAPPVVVHSKTVYLGDYVNINSQTNTVNLGGAKLLSVSDAVNAQDVPSYKQVEAVQTSLTKSLSTTNTNLTNAVTTLTSAVTTLTSANTALIQRCSNLETTIINLHQFLFDDDPIPITFPFVYPANRI